MASTTESTEASTFPTLPTSTAAISTPHTVNIGTRKSNLARIQTDIVVEKLKEKWPQHNYVVHAISTMGDKNQVSALHDFGAKSLWTFELEDMLLDGTVDFIVHSLKDMPTQLPPKCDLGAILERHDARDAVVFAPRFFTGASPAPTLASLPRGSVIGTSSVRRTAQLKRLYPHLAFESVRGNLETRLRKLDADDSVYSALILAAAGLQRIQQGHRISGFLESNNADGRSKDHHGVADKLPASDSPDEGRDAGKGVKELERRQEVIGDKKWGMLHAVGQGALGIEIREGDARVEELLEPLRHKQTTLMCLAERSLMRTLEGGCSVPIGVETEWVKDDKDGLEKLTMRAIVVSLDGSEIAQAEIKEKLLRSNADAEEFGVEIANLLKDTDKGNDAEKILRAINKDRPAVDEGTGAAKTSQ